MAGNTRVVRGKRGLESEVLVHDSEENIGFIENIGILLCRTTDMSERGLLTGPTSP